MKTLHSGNLFIKKFNDTFEDIVDNRHTHYTFPGGRGGTKSSFIGFVIPLLIVNNPNVHAAVFRRQSNTLRDSVFAQINAGITMLGLEDEFRSTVSPMEIVYKPTGQKILFRGLDAPEKIKSIKVPFGYIAITWFEELDQFDGRAAIRKVLQSTMRGGSTFWNFESFNPPISSSNWTNKDLLINRSDRLITWSNYLDVPAAWLGEQFFEEAEFLRDINERAYRHEYLGEAVGTGGMVFENVRNEPITDEQINTFDRLYNGVDWGWYPDPWAFNRCHYDAARRTLYIFDEARAHKAKNQKTYDIVKGKMRPGELVTCDSAEPKSVDDYRVFGISDNIHARPAIKGPGSVEYRMKWLQGLTAIIIDQRRCPFTFEEFTEYEYERNKAGETISGYPDKKNHHIDAVCYALEPVWHVKGQ